MQSQKICLFRVKIIVTKSNLPSTISSFRLHIYAHEALNDCAYSCPNNFHQYGSYNCFINYYLSCNHERKVQSKDREREREKERSARARTPPIILSLTNARDRKRLVHRERAPKPG